MLRWLTIYSSLAMQAFISRNIKAPLLEIIDSTPVITLVNLWKLIKVIRQIKKLPEPTKENTWCLNTHTLIEQRDYFFEHVKLDPIRKKFIWLFWNFAIIIHDFDIVYRFYIDEIGVEFQKTNWEPGKLNNSERYWKENHGNKGIKG